MSELLRPVRYEFGRFRLDPHQRLLSDEQQAPVALTPRAFDLLLCLVERAGQLLDKSTLLKAVWPNVIVEENNLSQHLSALRHALGDGGDGERYIVTVPRRGYRFVAEVRITAALTSASERAREPSRASVAVLPFANLSGDAAKEYFGDGLAEELIHLLSRVPGLAVPARTSSFAYKGRSLNVQMIARQLRVATVLEGSVRSAGERVRVTAQLVDAVSGYHLWSQSYDRSFEDIFRLQDEIASAIVEAIRVHMSVTLGPLAAAPPPTRDLEAYRLYLQGASVAARGAEPGVLAGIALLEQAIERDPNFARALGTLAVRRLGLSFYGHPDAMANAERDARSALSLDPSLPEAHSALGMVSIVRHRWRDAEASFAAPQALGERDLTSFAHALYLPASVGYLQQSLARLREGYDRTPAEAPLLAMLAVATIAVSRQSAHTDEAARHAELAVSLGMPKNAGPLAIVRLYVALRRGRRADVLDAAQDVGNQFLPAAPERLGRLIEQVSAALDDPQALDTARHALDSFVASLGLSAIGPVLAVQLVAWYTLLGAVTSAYDFVDRILGNAKATGSMGILLTWLWHPELLAFRRDARFEPLVERLGLMDYWQHRGPPDGYELRDRRLIQL
ncbi:MAG: winged helix-turn-helix domain-containing protein [Steroidobacteraceae bacterium]